MKKLLLTLPITLFVLAMVNLAMGQSYLVERPIVATDTITDDDGVELVVSHDDAEQENDEMDSLTDDDIDAGWEGEADDQNILTAGLRFQNISIPKGATIDSAYILVFSHEGKSTEDVANLTILGEDSDNPETFTLDALITDRPVIDDSVEWIVDDVWEIYQPYRTVDLSVIVQSLVDREGWKAGNAMAFIIKGQNQGPSEVENAREFEAFENIADPEDGGDGQNHPERVPRLFVYYSLDSNLVNQPIIATDTIEDEDGVTLIVSSDDAEQENDEMDSLTDDDIDTGWEGEADDQNVLTAGLRFQNIIIPQGASIDSAYFILHSHEGKSTEDVANITIVGEATDNAETFTLDALITDRPETDASVLWVVDDVWEIYQPYRSADISPIVQELVNREGWNPGNAMAFILKGEDQGPSEVENAREFEAFENIADPEDGGDGQNHPERVPRLVVYFSAGSGAPTSIFQSIPTEYNQLLVYPNPVDKGIVNIEMATAKPALIKLFNQNGQLISQEVSEFGKQVSLKTSTLPSGLYILQATQNNTIYTHKLIIKN